jgi:OFA family oxalate/formate antiporter-like MFS transporter
MPGILSDKFGMSDISKIHGAVLSAWGVAGLIGNNLSMMVQERYGYSVVLWMICGLYLLNIVNWLSLKRQ